MVILLFLKSFLGSKNGMICAVILGLLIGGYSWHRSVVREAEQAAIQNTRVEVMKENDVEYQQFKKDYADNIQKIQDQIDTLTKQQANSKVVVRTIVEKQNVQDKNIDQLNNASDVISDIRSRLQGTGK